MARGSRCSSGFVFGFDFGASAGQRLRIARRLAVLACAALAAGGPGGVLAAGLSTPTSGQAIDVDAAAPAAPHAGGAAVGALSGSVHAGAASLQLRTQSMRGWLRVPLGPRRTDGRRAWSVQGLPLHAGPNRIELRVRDAAHRASVRWATIGPPRDLASPALELRPVTWLGQARLAEVRHGHLLIEGDIDLGAVPPPEDAQAGRAHADAGLGIADPASFWPRSGGVAHIPYIVSQGNDNVAPAIAQVNSQLAGILQLVPRGTEADYVDVALDPDDFSGSGEASVGRIGGHQIITGSILADQGTLVHEIGHTIGLYHEQSRPDRDAYVKVMDADIIKTLEPNFDIQRSNVQNFGLYDVQSIMHYLPWTFTKNGEPTLETVPPGIRMSDLGMMSPGDVDAIARLYGQAPTRVTVTSNPPGLDVLVDGAHVTTPQSFSFVLGSQHTLAVATATQAQDGDGYVFGRWNDGGAASHTITIAPGNGLEASPAARPAVTMYQADFVQMLPYAPFVYPAGAGTVTPSPPPQALQGLGGLYYPARAQVTLTAAPASGQGLYRLYTADGGEAENPRTTRHPDWVLAYFTSQPVITVTTDPAVHWSWVDDVFHETPTHFSADYAGDGDWTPGTSHTLDMSVDPQQPYSWSIRYPWLAWSDGGDRRHGVVSPGAPATYTASLDTQFNFAAWAAQPCAGNVMANPASQDNFYDVGTTVNFDEAPVSGWTFSGWLADLSGKTHPQALVMSDERLVVAGFDTNATPLALTSLAPDHAVAGSKSLALTITGTGFTAATRVFIDGAYVAPSKATATTLKVKVPAAALKNVGGAEISVDNVPSGNWPCSAYVIHTLPVLAKGAVALLAASPPKLVFGKQKVGKASAPQSVTLANDGSALAAVHAPAITGPDASDFTLSTTCASSLAAAAQCTVSVTFKPGAKGARAATLMLLDSAFDSPQAVSLGGTGS